MTGVIEVMPLDTTGKNPGNLVEHEERTLGLRKIRCIAPLYGAFFSKSLVVYDRGNRVQLQLGIDYEVGELVATPSELYGQDIRSVVIITNELVSSDISLTYQALGGQYYYNAQAIVDLIDKLSIDNRPVAYKSILGLPADFNPTEHMHDAGDVYGFEYVVNAINLVSRSILLGDTGSHEEIYKYVDATADELRSSFITPEQVREYVLPMVANDPDFGNSVYEVMAQLINFTFRQGSQFLALQKKVNQLDNKILSLENTLAKLTGTQ